MEHVLYTCYIYRSRTAVPWMVCGMDIQVSKKETFNMRE